MITSLPELAKALAHARAVYERRRDGGTDRHMNPGRARREVLAAHEANAAFSLIEKAFQTAEAAELAGVSWQYLDGQVSLILGPERQIPAAAPAHIKGQLAVISSPDALAYFEHCHADHTSKVSQIITREQALLLQLRQYQPRALKWVTQRLEGATSRLRTTLFTDLGLLERDMSNELVLSQSGAATGFFIERIGTYGTYQDLTPTGIRWLYATYLAGKCPMAKGATNLEPVPNAELQAIADIAPDPAFCVPPRILVTMRKA